MGHLTKRLQGALKNAFHGVRRNSVYPRIQYGPLKFGPPLRSLSKTDLERLEQIERVRMTQNLQLDDIFLAPSELKIYRMVGRSVGLI